MALSPRQKRLGELLAFYRHQAGLKQADVAAALGRHQPFITNIESGQRRVDVVELIEFADVLGFDITAVIDELKKVPV
jgi:transcriptional regulator with XRE-family HTH domain